MPVSPASAQHPTVLYVLQLITDRPLQIVVALMAIMMVGVLFAPPATTPVRLALMA